MFVFFVHLLLLRAFFSFFDDALVLVVLVVLSVRCAFLRVAVFYLCDVIQIFNVMVFIDAALRHTPAFFALFNKMNDSWIMALQSRSLSVIWRIELFVR